jgi:rhodanese-related sulfurtransferase
MPNAVNIPLPDLRARMGEVQAAAARGPIRLYCMVGFRSYQAYRILHQHGVADVATLSGGAKTFLGFYHTNLASGQADLPVIVHAAADLVAEALLDH